MECRKCGACCIALSISSLDKPAGARCEHLTAENLCALWGKPERPEVCSAYRPDPLFCGGSFQEALELMRAAEEEQAPRSSPAGTSGRTPQSRLRGDGSG